MKVFIVYCHPSTDSFTYQVKEAFLKGLKEAGHSYVMSDLYQMGFNPVISEKEYKREAFYLEDEEISSDIKKEHEKIDSADAIVFIYPDFWTASPAMLEGWFQRVLTYGYAYGPNPDMHIPDKALFLVTIGGSLKDQIRKDQVEAMERVMIGDRMRNRAKKFEVHIFDEMTRGYGNDQHRNENIDKFTKQAYQIAKDL